MFRARQRERCPLNWDDRSSLRSHSLCREDTWQVRLPHTLARTRAVFDDPNLVSHGGLVPVVALAERAGLPELLAERLSGQLLRLGARFRSILGCGVADVRLVSRACRGRSGTGRSRRCPPSRVRGSVAGSPPCADSRPRMCFLAPPRPRKARRARARAWPSER
jgi:hypothetical protein